LADRRPDASAVLHSRAPTLGASALASSSGTQERRVVADVIDGKAMAAALRARVADEVRELASNHHITPGLAVVLVGSDPASEIYTAAKKKMSAQVGIRSFAEHLPASTTEAELIELIERLNGNPDVHGILVQLPLPAHVDPLKVVSAIDPAKDVDGFHPLNVGRLALGQPALTPCTPLACIMLAKSVHPSLAGLEALVIGRSTIVGKPLSQLLVAENATVTVAHSKSSDLPALARRADLLFSAVGPSSFGRIGSGPARR
jgi:methylenetetrahydrofolate dehydrogenase (NADP+) / methenyltetrahydrofolate cyclohydrolase